MFEKLGKLPFLFGQSVASSVIPPSNVTLTKKTGFFGQIFDLKNFHISPVCSIVKQNKGSVKRVVKDDGLKPDYTYSSKQVIYPDESLPDRMFNGILYKELPIVNIKVTRNNTIINLTDHKGNSKLLRSCGVEGFKNTKKGTNLAAQATALTFSKRALDLGYKTVRVRIQGLGPGRISSFRGLIVGGMDIVSVTDNSRVADVYPRPKKMRRL